MELTIRLAHDDEIDIVASLIVDAYAEFAASMSPDAWSMFAQDIANVHGRRSDGEVVVAIDSDDKIVGTMTMFRDWRGAQEGVMAVRLLAVPPEKRNQGVGSALMAWAVEQARSGGKTRVVLTVMQVMDAMRDIVEKEGFERLPQMDHEPAPGVRAEGFGLELGQPVGNASGSE